MLLMGAFQQMDIEIIPTYPRKDNACADGGMKLHYGNLNSELDKGRQESHIFVREMERRLLGLPGVGNQTGDEIDDKVGRAPMTGVFNL